MRLASTTVVLVVAAGGLGFTLPRESLSQRVATASRYEAPIVDLTTSLGRLHPDGTQQVQTYYPAVGPGRVSSAKVPGCLGSGEKDAGSNCVRLCARMPSGSQLVKVEGFAQEVRTPPWLACDSKNCLGRPVAQAQALFDPAGFTRDRTPEGDRVCWIFRNWHLSEDRIAVLLLTFRAPADEGRPNSALEPAAHLEENIQALRLSADVRPTNQRGVRQTNRGGLL